MGNKRIKKLAAAVCMTVVGLAAGIMTTAAFCPSAAASLQVQAKAITTVKKKQNIKMKKLTPALKRKIAASTPAEKAGSDLTLRYPAARLTTARLPPVFLFFYSPFSR